MSQDYSGLDPFERPELAAPPHPVMTIDYAQLIDRSVAVALAEVRIKLQEAVEGIAFHEGPGWEQRSRKPDAIRADVKRAINVVLG